MGAIPGERLVGDHFDRVRGYVRVRVPERDREDVVADVFLRALERRGELRSGDPLPWLLAIARSRVADYYRGREAAMADPRDGARPPAPTPLEELERREFLDLMRRKMLVLSEAERDAVALKFTEGLSNVEIASALGVTPTNLGVIVHRALARLREAMLSEVANGVP